MIRYIKFAVFVAIGLLLIAAANEKLGGERKASLQSGKNLTTNNLTPLIDVSANPKGLVVPSAFLGVHLNRWKDSTSITFDINDYHGGYSQVAKAIVANVNGVPILTMPKGNGFYNYRKGVTVRLLGMGAGGADFITKVVSGTLGPANANAPLLFAQLSAMPTKLGSCTVQYRPYIPTFGYGSVRSHGSDVKWSTLHLGHGSYNTALMSDWVKRHAGKKLMFTMTDTPEWLAASNISASARSVQGYKATISHSASSIGVIPVGTDIKVRYCSNPALNGRFTVTQSSTTTTSFIVHTANEESTADNKTEILIWSNNGGYGANNPPKDMTEINKFIIWLMTNFGNNIDWIEGQNEANSSFMQNGSLAQGQGQASWWMGTITQLGEMQKRIYLAAKAIKPSVLIGSPALTGLTPEQPINKSDVNKSSSYQLLTASDGAGGKLADWIDFLPIHIYDIGADWRLEPRNHWTLYDLLGYVHDIVSEKSINKPSIPIYMNEGGFQVYGTFESQAFKFFNAMTPQQQSNEIFKQAAIYAGNGVKGFYPWTTGFLGDFETTPEIAATYDKVNKRIAGKTISPDSWFNKETGEMFYKTTDGYEEYLP